MYLFSILKDYLIEPNILVSNLVTVPIIFLGMYVNLLFFMNLFKFEVSKKQMYQYIILVDYGQIFAIFLYQILLDYL